jgi:predicted methyltransferase
MDRTFVAGSAGLAAAWCAIFLFEAKSLANNPADIASALNDPRRPQSDRAMDASRKPLDVVAFAGVKPGDKVADFMPGNAYFTRIFSDVVGPKGKVYAVLSAGMERHCKPEEFAGTHVVEHDLSYRNVKVSSLPVMRFATPEPVDVAFTAQNYHDLHDAMNDGADVVEVDRAVFRALKPGGVFVVVDHVAEAGSGIRDTETLHRIDPEAIKREAETAGFVFEAESQALRSPADDHHLLVFNPAIRGHTDQVILKFRKPRI